jgi:hypothetical protein
MIVLFRLRVALAVLLAACASVRGQSFSVTVPNYVGTKLFDSAAGTLITGMAADAVGNVYYIQTDVAGFGDTFLYKRSAMDSYANPTPLCNLGFRVGGAFVVCSGSTVYFGDNTEGNIYSINNDGSGFDPLGTIASAKSDAKFVNGHLFITYDGGNSNTLLSRFDLIADGAGGKVLANENVIVNAARDPSGVFEYAGAELYYGASGYDISKGIYKFSQAEVDGAITAGELTLQANHKFGTTTTNSVGALAFGGGVDLWKDDPFSTDLRLFSRFNGGVSVIGSAGLNSTLGQLDFGGESLGPGALFMNVSDNVNYRSAIYRLAVPEPSSALMLLAGSLVLARRRR